MELRHNIVYRITNVINNKIYIGVHKTDNLDDGYMGSGKVIKNAIKKHGIQNFNKEVLFDYPAYYMALEKEKELVDDTFLKREDVYNLRRGGDGGFDFINKNLLQNTTRNTQKRKERLPKMKKSFRNLYNNSEGFRKILSENGKKGSEKVLEKYPEGTFKGRKHTPETRKKISDSKRGKQTTSTLGKHWFTNGTKNISAYECPKGYHKGRTL